MIIIPPFTEWLEWIFNRPQEETEEWEWDEVNQDWIIHRSAPDYQSLPNAVVLPLLTEAFERAGEVLPGYSDAQVAEGIAYLSNPSFSNYPFCILDDTLPWKDRARCIRAIHTVFEQCFARRCSPTWRRWHAVGEHRLNLVCYMWWEVFPVHGEPKNAACAERDRLFLQVMQRILLTLDSHPCQESALHGLGHWQIYYPQKVAAIIDEYLMQLADPQSDLKEYALAARMGRIL